MNKDAKLEKGQDSTYKWTTQQQISNHSLFASEWHVPERKQVFFVKPPDTANAIPFHFSSSQVQTIQSQAKSVEKDRAEGSITSQSPPLLDIS